MIYCHFPLVDGPQDDQTILDVAIQTVALLLKKQIPTTFRRISGKRFSGRAEPCS